jgi:hypothetical protein
MKFRVLILIVTLAMGGCMQPPAYQPQPITYNNFNKSYSSQQITNQQNPFINKSTNITAANNLNYSPSASQNTENINTFMISVNRYSTQIQGISSYETCGITAVMISLKNQTKQPIYIDWGQFSASNGSGEYAPYPPQDVATIMMNSEGFNQVVNGAVSGAVAGAAGGALLGGTVMAALGGNFADGAKWGAVGGATGGMAGGAVAYKQQLAQAVASEIESRKLTPRNVYPSATIMGVLYFPAGISKINVYLPEQTISLDIQ